MKVVIATDGSMDVATALPYVAPLAGDEEIVVLTVIEVPRALLRDMRLVYGGGEGVAVETDGEYVANKVADMSVTSWPGDDALLDRYLEDQGEQRAGVLAEGLAATGLNVRVDVREGEDAAAGVLAALSELEADVVVASATGRGLFQGLMGATSTKLARLAPCPVLLIRG